MNGTGSRRWLLHSFSLWPVTFNLHLNSPPFFPSPTPPPPTHSPHRHLCDRGNARTSNSTADLLGFVQGMVLRARDIAQSSGSISMSLIAKVCATRSRTVITNSSDRAVARVGANINWGHMEHFSRATELLKVGSRA